MLKDPIKIIGPASLVGNSRETFHKSGTDGSNPVPSSGESTNFELILQTLARYPLLDGISGLGGGGCNSRISRIP